jgi:hypothetical protein
MGQWRQAGQAIATPQRRLRILGNDEIDALCGRPRATPHTVLRSRSQRGKVRWEVFLAIKRTCLLQRPKLSVPYRRLKQYATFCGEPAVGDCRRRPSLEGSDPSYPTGILAIARKRSKVQQNPVIAIIIINGSIVIRYRTFVLYTV